MRRPFTFLCLISLVLACDLVDPDTAIEQDGGALQVVIAASEMPSYYRDAFDLVDRAWLRLGLGGEARDTVLPIVNDDGTARFRLLVTPQELRDGLTLEVELRTGATSLFDGEGTTAGTSGPAPTISVALRPVTSRIFVSATPMDVDALGDTATLTADARMGTGLSIPGASIEWRTSDSEVLSILPGNRITPRANGRAILTATSGGTEANLSYVIRQNPANLVGAAPADTTVSVADAYQLRLLGEDPRGFPLLVGANVTWTATGTVTVDDEGYVTPTSEGVGSVTASTTGGVAYTVYVTVIG